MRLPQLPERSFFLFGMKGTGKRAWIDQMIPDSAYVDMTDEVLRSRLKKYPKFLGQFLQTVMPGQWVVVNELQRVPSLINEIYSLIAQRGMRFVLLSSNIRTLKAEYETDLTHGRIQTMNMYPLTPAELGDAFNLEEVLRLRHSRCSLDCRRSRRNPPSHPQHRTNRNA